MQDKHLFEYAVVRIVPRVEREEFLNVGVIVYCKKQNFLEAKISLDVERIRSFAPCIDTDDLQQHLSAFENISKGNISFGPIAQLDTSLRFRWLTAIRSTVLQTSKVHPGFCTDLHETLQKLHNQLVLPVSISVQNI